MTQPLPLPHALYLTQVHSALTDIGLTPDDHTLDDCDTRGSHRYLRGILHYTHTQHWPHGLLLVWEWHTGIEADLGEPERGPVWLWARGCPDGSNSEPELLPVDGYALPTRVAAVWDAIVEKRPARQVRPARWRMADALDAACEAWALAETTP